MPCAVVHARRAVARACRVQEAVYGHGVEMGDGPRGAPESFGERDALAACGVVNDLVSGLPTDGPASPSMPPRS